MKIVIVGPGAMGCLFGALLAESGEEVWLLDHRQERARELAEQGIRVEGISGDHHARVHATVEPKEAAGAGLIIVCVKSYDTAAVARRIKEFAGRETLILTLQNGAGNLEELAGVLGPERLLGGVTSQGATMLGPGHVRHAGRGDTIIGPYQKESQKSKGKRQKLEEIVRVFEKAGFPAGNSDNVQDLIWSKLIINVGINALTALTRLNNGRLPEFAGTKEILRLAVEEAAAVARSKGIKLAYPDPVAKTEEVCRATSGNVCSMLQDVLKQRRTEIDYINGAVVKAGRELGVAVPVNRVLTGLVKTLEESYAQRVERI